MVVRLQEDLEVVYQRRAVAVAEEHDLHSRASALTAVLALICGLLLLDVSRRGLANPSVKIVDQLVVFNSRYPDPTYVTDHLDDLVDDLPPITTGRIMTSLCWMSALVVVTAVVGIVGAMLQSKGPVCVYVIVASCLSLVVLVSAMQTSERRVLAAPVLMQQVEDLCASGTYMQLTSAIGCDCAAKYDQSEVVPCDSLCQFRVRNLGRIKDSCKVLQELCGSFSYRQVKLGGCVKAAFVTPGMLVFRHQGTSMGVEECELACDTDIGCEIVIHLKQDITKEEQCLVTSAVASYHDPENWTEIDRESFLRAHNASKQTAVLLPDWSHTCLRRAEPHVLLMFMKHGLHIAVATALLGLVLMLSTLCTCCILYNVNMSRQGLPTAWELGYMMMCPCCARRMHQKFHGVVFDEDKDDHHDLHDSEDEDDEEDDDGFVIVK